MNLKFRIVHVQDKKIQAPDATSRHPSPKGYSVDSTSASVKPIRVDMYAPFRIETENDNSEEAIIT